MLGKTDASFLKNTRPLYSVRKRRVRSITTSKRCYFQRRSHKWADNNSDFSNSKRGKFFLRQFCVKNGWSMLVCACVDRSLSATNLNFFVTYIGRCVSHVSLLFIPGNHIFTICLPGLSLGSTSTLCTFQLNARIDAIHLNLWTMREHKTFWIQISSLKWM